MSKLGDLCFHTKHHRCLEVWGDNHTVTLYMEREHETVTYHLEEGEVRQLHTWLGAWLSDSEDKVGR